MGRWSGWNKVKVPKKLRRAKAVKVSELETPENIVKHFIEEWLETSGVLNSRLQPVRIATGPDGKPMLVPPYASQAGQADFLVFINGRDIAFECKSSKGKQRADQKKWEKRWQASGSNKEYYIVKTPEEFLAVLSAGHKITRQEALQTSAKILMDAEKERLQLL